jgi:glycosyltransferase involved in cell wall biosynthesis
MASGIPIACSNLGPMPEVLGDAGVYFNPEKPSEIADALLRLISNPDLRLKNALLAYKQAQKYTWERCADETFHFIAEVAKDWQASHVKD